jgi:hypothetical protein
MAETKTDDRDMSAHIPEGSDSADSVERDMSAKTELGDGLHATSSSFGKVVSDDATDAEGLTPQAMAEQSEGKAGKNKKSKKKDE